MPTLIRDKTVDNGLKRLAKRQPQKVSKEWLASAIIRKALQISEDDPEAWQLISKHREAAPP
jgi:hypothetical protein